LQKVNIGTASSLSPLIAY